MLPSPAWNTLGMRRAYFSLVARMNRMISGNFERGTTPSWVRKFGLSRPMAPKARFQHFQFHDQDRPRVERKAKVIRRLDRLGDELVHHFHRAGHDSGRDDVADTL